MILDHTREIYQFIYFPIRFNILITTQSKISRRHHGIIRFTGYTPYVLFTLRKDIREAFAVRKKEATKIRKKMSGVTDGTRAKKRAEIRQPAGAKKSNV